MKTDIFKVIFVSLIVSIIISIVTLVVYDVALTPSNQQKQIDNINTYLKQLIIGYTTV